jgi:hypothetical protein
MKLAVFCILTSKLVRKLLYLHQKVISGQVLPLPCDHQPTLQHPFKREAHDPDAH